MVVVSNPNTISTRIAIDRFVIAVLQQCITRITIPETSIHISTDWNHHFLSLARSSLKRFDDALAVLVLAATKLGLVSLDSCILCPKPDDGHRTALAQAISTAISLLLPSSFAPHLAQDDNIGAQNGQPDVTNRT